MALDKVLKIYDENGNPVDYDILASDVKFLPDGKDLPTKLTEMEDAIKDAAEGGGYTPPQGGIPKTDLAPAVQASLDKADSALQSSDLEGYATTDDVDDAVADLVSSAPQTLDTLKELADALGDDPNFATSMATQLGNKVDKETGKGLSTNDYTTAEKTKLAGIDPSTYATKTEVNAKQDVINDLSAIRSGAGKGATSVQTISVNGGAAQQPTNGVINLTVATGGDNDLVGLSDGTANDGAVVFTKRNGDTITLDLNHVHPQYLKYELLTDEAAYTALATKDSGTLYLIPES